MFSGFFKIYLSVLCVVNSKLVIIIVCSTKRLIICPPPPVVFAVTFVWRVKWKIFFNKTVTLQTEENSVSWNKTQRVQYTHGRMSACNKCNGLVREQRWRSLIKWNTRVYSILFILSNWAYTSAYPQITNIIITVLTYAAISRRRSQLMTNAFPIYYAENSLKCPRKNFVGNTFTVSHAIVWEVLLDNMSNFVVNTAMSCAAAKRVQAEYTRFETDHSMYLIRKRRLVMLQMTRGSDAVKYVRLRMRW